ncbi:MAG: hypothetical protein ACK5XN_06010 [Bacteroidota bacterium]
MANDVFWKRVRTSERIVRFADTQKLESPSKTRSLYFVIGKVNQALPKDKRVFVTDLSTTDALVEVAELVSRRLNDIAMLHECGAYFDGKNVYIAKKSHISRFLNMTPPLKSDDGYPF